VKRTEIEATGKLAGDALGGTGALIRDVHRGVSGRIFKTLGPIGAPVRLAHDGISTAVFASVRLGLRGVPRALTPLAPPDTRGLADSPAGRVVLGAVNGMWGDRVAKEYAPLAVPMSLRVDGEGARVVVFVHGLCETDAAWALGGGPTYGDRLREDLGYTPVYATYNTGLHISENGRALAAALEALDAEEIVLIGHSMGGLVARSACRYATAELAERIRHVFCLGSPHLGAPLERAANRGGHLLTRLPETAPFARLLTIRSAGVKDLRHGACVEEDWDGFDPDDPTDRCTDVPFLAGATYCYIGATVTRRKDGRLADILGDLLVQFPSASGDGPTRRLAFEIENGLHVGGIHHMQLLNHPKVYAQLKKWLERKPALTA
jgi:pimeloyl-ACP methyl ester carboxylesterase